MNQCFEGIFYQKIYGVNLSYLESLFNLNKKVVLVTGSCGQLGTVICSAFKNSGCQVIGLDINTNENLIDGIIILKL